MRNYLLLALLILPACATSVGSSVGNSGIKISLAKDVENCEFLGDVHGVSSFYGVFAASALESSRQSAMKRAAELGATNIVWQTNDTSYGSTSVTGNAFNCD